MLKKEFYILKLDIAKYFYSINHNKLKEMLKEDFNDEYMYKYIKDKYSDIRAINDYHTT